MAQKYWILASLLFINLPIFAETDELATAPVSEKTLVQYSSDSLLIIKKQDGRYLCISFSATDNVFFSEITRQARAALLALLVKEIPTIDAETAKLLMKRLIRTNKDIVGKITIFSWDRDRFKEVADEYNDKIGDIIGKTIIEVSPVLLTASSL